MVERWALGIEVRAGLHTGEVERVGDKIGGLAVNIGARVALTLNSAQTEATPTAANMA